MAMTAQALTIALKHHQSGNFQQAEQLYRQILQVEPNHADALHLLGVLAHQVGKNEVAIDYIGQAIVVNTSNGVYHSNMGAAYQALGRFDEAIASYEQALQIQPDFAEAYYNLGNLLQKNGRLDEAGASYRAALRINPNFAEAHNNLGNLLKAQGRLDEAVECYQQALRIKPGFAEAYNNLGNAHQRSGQFDAAVGCYQQSLQIQPDYVESYNNLGIALNVQGKLDEAMENFKQALRIKPDYATAHSNQAFSLNYQPNVEPAAIFAEHRRWGEIYGRSSEAPSTYPNLPDPNRPLRIGYVSPDFRRHSVAFFIEPILTHHDRDNFEAICYAQVAIPDTTTARLGALADGWRSTYGMTDAQVAERVRTDAVDVLVDLTGHTAGNRLLVFARKPAPVQVTYGYASTTGLKTIDYRLTDRQAELPEHVDLYTEELVYLPDGLLCYAPPREASPVGPLPAHKVGHITFGSFNNLPKVNPQVVALWAQILREVPTARLILKSKPLSDAGTRERYFVLFESNGISRERVDLKGHTPSLAEHLAFHNAVDIGLDPFPYNGQTTTCEALWMGVPVVTLAGQKYVGRAGVSLLSRVGLTELTAETEEAYVTIAVQLAEDLERLSNIRTRLRSQVAGSQLCDGKTFTCGLEDVYRTMWRRWCEHGYTEMGPRARSEIPLIFDEDS